MCMLVVRDSIAHVRNGCSEAGMTHHVLLTQCSSSHTFTSDMHTSTPHKVEKLPSDLKASP